MIFGKAPFKNCIVLGHVQDENGQKMSKSKGNAVDPFEALETYGADAIRWYFYTNSAPWLPNKFHGKAVTEGQRKFMGTLWNVYAFYVLYAEIDGFNPTAYKLEYTALSVMDKWLLSRLNSMVRDVDTNLENYRIPEAARALQDFTDEMSNWYVRRGRERYWAPGMPQDKINAYLTLYTALVTLAKAAAPMIPFMTEDIYQNLVRGVDKTAPESIHLCRFPEWDESRIDPKLEADMDEVLQIVVLGRAARNGSNRKNRQPLRVMYVQAENVLADYYTEIIRDELNLKSVEFVDKELDLVDYSFKPQLKTLGPKFGKRLGEVRNVLAALDGAAAKAELDETGFVTLALSDGEVKLPPEDLLIETSQKEGYFTVSDRGITVTLDINLTPELEEEGFVREIISKVQTQRKEAGFEVLDRIALTASGSAKLEAILTRNRAEIAVEVLADSVAVTEPAGFVKDWTINGEEAKIGVAKIS